MKLNKLMIASLGVLALGGLSSCSDSWMDVSSKTESNSGNFYKSQEDGLRSLYACYDGWQRTVSDGPTFTVYQLCEAMSDECFGGTGNNDGRNTQIIDRFDMNQAPSYTDMHYTLWKSYYAAIFRCNEFIDKAEGITWDDETAKNTYLGEAHALRALCYLDMVRLWENIPLLEHATSEIVPQAQPDEVYDLIFTDLKYAIEHIPAGAYPKKDAADNDGHVTKYAAEAILARAYLFYSGYYGKDPAGCTKADALAACEDIISSGEFGLVERFRDLWPASSDDKSGGYKGLWADNSSWAGAGNMESVLSMKFNYTADYNGNNDGNRFQVMIGLRTGGLAYDRYGQGWGACTVDPAFVSSYGSGDSRKDASVIDATKLEGYEKNYLSDQREYTGYFIKKYTTLSKHSLEDDKLQHYTEDVGAGDYQISQFQDWVLVRYADVLLMAAELGSPNAQKYFNDVRKRAYIGDDGSLSSYYSEKPATQENIMKERKLEFAFEGIRYWDELRQGLDHAANEIAGTWDVKDGGEKTTVTISADNIKSKRGFIQIPLSEITLSNGQLKQNPGW